VKGCMMPSAELSTAFPTAVATGSYDGLSLNFMYYATVHDVASCVVARTGCMDSTARNYDPLATIQGTGGGTACYYYIDGCLNPLARNYGCTVRQDSDCPNSGATRHNAIFCKYPGEPVNGIPHPPSPPPPTAPSGGGYAATKVYTVRQAFLTSGTVDENIARARDVISAFATRLGVSQADLSSGAVVVTAYIIGEGRREGPYRLNADGTVSVVSIRRQLEGKRELQSSGTTTQWELKTTTPDESTAATFENTLRTSFNTAAAAQTFIGVPGLEVVADPAPATTTEVITYKKSGLTDAAQAGVIAGCVIGGVLIMVMILLVLRQRQKKGKAYAKTVVPA